MNTLRPLSKNVKPSLLWGFDIETYGTKNKFIMGSIVGDMGIRRSFWDKHEFCNFLKDNAYIFTKGKITATNLCFDMTSLIYETDLFKSMYPILRGSEMVYCKIPTSTRSYTTAKGEKRTYTDRSLKFIDTFSFLKTSVEKMGKILGIPKLPKPDFLGERPKTDKEKKILEEYNLRDSYITYRFIQFLQRTFNDMGAKLKVTIASTSMDLYKRKYLTGEMMQPSRDIMEYLFNGYYGGRCEAFVRGGVSPDVHLRGYDVNSLFPTCMLGHYPDPNKVSFIKRPSKHIIDENEGVACVTIESPKHLIPYLPFRTKDKLLFPTGKLRKSYYTFFEIREALKRGYKLLAVHDAVCYPDTIRPFKKFVEDLYAKRLEFQHDGDEREYAVKLLLNSLYGKFGQQIREKEVIVHESKMTYNHLIRSGAVRVGEFFIYKKFQNKLPKFINPIFSIYTTAYARHRLYELFERTGFDDVYYSDTDSIFIPKRLPTGEELGEVKDIWGREVEGVIIKPKMYRLDSTVKCKGLGRMTPLEFEELLSTKKRKMERFSKFKESNRRGLAYNEKLSFFKYLDLNDDKRLWGGDFSEEILEGSRPRDASRLVPLHIYSKT